MFGLVEFDNNTPKIGIGCAVSYRALVSFSQRVNNAFSEFNNRLPISFGIFHEQEVMGESVGLFT